MQKIEKKLKKGEVLAFKTDTVWGFGVDPCDYFPIDNLYEIKKRDTKKPLILMSSDIKYLSKYIKSIPLYAQKLIDKYLPGALTLIFEKSDILNPKVTSYSNTVGIRIPDSKDYFNLIDSLENKVLATTSCNLSTQPPVRNYKEACEKFSSCATIIKPIDDTVNNNTPSTVILCEEEGYKVLRTGAIKL